MLSLIRVAYQRKMEPFETVVGAWSEKRRVKSWLHSVHVRGVPNDFVIGQRKAINALAKLKKWGVKPDSTVFFTEGQWDIYDKKLPGFADKFCDLTPQNVSRFFPRVLLHESLADVLNAHDETESRGVHVETFTQEDIVSMGGTPHFEVNPKHQSMDHPSTPFLKKRDRYIHAERDAQLDGAEFYHWIGDNRKRLQSGQHVCLKLTDSPAVTYARANRFVRVQKAFITDDGKHIPAKSFGVEIDLLKPLRETHDGKALFQKKTKKRDIVMKKAVHHMFNDNRWFFATDESAGIWKKRQFIPVECIVDAVSWHKTPSECQDIFEHGRHIYSIWGKWRMLNMSGSADPAYVDYNGEEYQPPFPKLPTVIAVDNHGVIFAQKADYQKSATGEGSRTVSGIPFIPLRKLVERGVLCQTCNAHDCLENEWALQNTEGITFTIKESEHVKEVYMQYEPESGVPAFLAGFHPGVHPRYVHLFRHYFNPAKRVLTHLPQHNPLRDTFPTFVEKYPLHRNGLVELFGGAGISSIGFQRAGFKKQRIVENNIHALKSNVYNNPESRVWHASKPLGSGNGNDSDERKDDSDSSTGFESLHDEICDEKEAFSIFREMRTGKANFPSHVGVVSSTCQCTFSSGLNRQKDDSTKAEYDRACMIEDLSAKMFFFPPHIGFFENIPNLSKLNPRTWAAMRLFLLLANYQIRSQILNSADFGLPHARERLFLTYAPCGSTMPDEPTPTHFRPGRRKVQSDFPFATPTIKEAIGDLMNVSPFHDEYAAHPNIPWKQRREVPYIEEGHTDRDLSGHADEDGNPFPHRRQHIPLKRPYWDMPGKCVGTIVGDDKKGDLHPLENRWLTLRERMRLFGLPDQFQIFGPLSAQCQQIGNGVPVPITFAFAIEARKALSKDERARRTDETRQVPKAQHRRDTKPRSKEIGGMS
ncbi:S-adenosyl-L-methionine-dependent methyltransferase [Powellomyces hirtus]|nr:S-adenosyl-L-methionine-dependent methyltransferase [Powellomyces hirtus]